MAMMHLHRGENKILDKVLYVGEHCMEYAIHFKFSQGHRRFNSIVVTQLIDLK